MFTFINSYPDLFKTKKVLFFHLLFLGGKKKTKTTNHLHYSKKNPPKNTKKKSITLPLPNSILLHTYSLITHKLRGLFLPFPPNLSAFQITG